MERNTQKNGLINLLAMVIVGLAAYSVARYGATFSGIISAVFLGIGALVAAVSWFQMRLENRERLEKLEFDELTKSAASAALFNAQETEVFPAQRSREQFERFFVPVFTVLLFLLQAGGAFLLWRWLAGSSATPLNEPKVALGLFSVFGLLLLLLGIFSTSLARLEGLRLLRPGATYLLMNAFLCFGVAIAIGVVVLSVPAADLYVARGLTILLFIIGLETLITLILEIYRPRMKGKVERPVYESRLVSLLGQPQGLITTAAQTLDYQFGFKVSETWAYRLFRQWVFRLILLQLAVFLVFTCFVFVDPGEQAVLERFGNPVAVLNPGPHLKLPWPIEVVYRYPTERIQSFSVGFTPEANPIATNTVLWTVSHSQEENFPVANRDTNSRSATTNDASGRPVPPVSLLTVGIPVSFQITNIEDWIYINEEPDTLLKHIATREVVRYLVSADLNEIMSSGRTAAADTLLKRIQEGANKRSLGVHITFVGLQYIHPPVKVSADYEKVVAAKSVRQAAILSARADAIRTNAYASALAYKTVADAESDRLRRQVSALARASLFTNQLPAYLAAPSVYAERAYMQAFTRSVGKARKYILLATNTQDVVILDLEDKIAEEAIENITVPPPKTPGK
jgi:regulator of protease activity HflC (stomatin/prohibitin superfamily)